MPPLIRKILFTFLGFQLFTSLYSSFYAEQYRPMHLVPQSKWPQFSDDLPPQSLTDCLGEQKIWLESQTPGYFSIFGDEIFGRERLLNSIEKLLTVLHATSATSEFNAFLRQNFYLFQAGGRRGHHNREMLITGYYEPVFAGSPTRQPPFIYPIYTRPEELVTRRIHGKEQTGRLTAAGQFLPFWDRREIETKQLLRGRELAWLKDPFDAYLLHVQGSGRLRFPDGSLHSVRFAGSNGLEYMSIGKLMADEKIMPRDKVTVPAIRQYLESHPDQRESLLFHNPRYIFFASGDDRGPSGSSGRVLTPGRSIAIDNSALPPGTVAFLTTRKPLFAQDDSLLVWEDMHRFVCPQDTGAAIKGTGRVDVFWGNSHYAELAASHMKESGSLYFLIAKP